MVNTVILSYITFFYFVSFFFYLLMMVMGKSILGRIATYVTLGGFVVHTFAIILRWIESYDLGIGHAPLSNLYESLIFFAWTIILLYLLMANEKQEPWGHCLATRLWGHGLWFLFTDHQ
jgi:ABC-type transport system involved in cytochrome c biogenesis permease subunit